MLFSDLQNIIDGNVLHQYVDLEIIQLAIDSRNISHGHQNALFFAINGNNHNVQMTTRSTQVQNRFNCFH